MEAHEQQALKPYVLHTAYIYIIDEQMNEMVTWMYAHRNTPSTLCVVT